MRRIVAQEFVSLDGVMQAPGGPDEDTTSDFAYGGWTAPYYGQADSEGDALMEKWMQPADLLLGRKTFDIFESYWPGHADFWPGIMDVTKYCVSTVRSESHWDNSEFLSDIDAVTTLKESGDADLHVIGGSALLHSLLENDLVDVLHLMTFPVILGEGKRLFSQNSVPSAFTFSEGLITTNGVVFASYEKTGPVITGSVGA